MVMESQAKGALCGRGRLAELRFADWTREMELTTADMDGVCTRQRVPMWMDTQLLEKGPSHSPYSIKFVSVNRKQKYMSKHFPQKCVVPPRRPNVLHSLSLTSVISKSKGPGQGRSPLQALS